MQKPLASAIQKKSTDGFFLAGMFYSFLPINKERMEARVRGHTAQRFAICLRTPFFSTGVFGEMFPSTSSGNGFVSCQTISSHGGRVSNMQKPLASAIQKKSKDGFFLATYARLEGRGTRCRRQWSESGTLESG